MSRLFITTNYGVIEYDISNRRIRELKIPKATLGFFGITFDEASNTIYAVSREKLGFSLAKLFARAKRSSDVIVYTWKPGEETLFASHCLYNVFDVHQIAIAGDSLILTDTAKNRLHILNRRTGRKKIMNVGKIRKDINHINAVLVQSHSLYVGLNNRGAESQVLVLPDIASLLAQQGNMDILPMGELMNLTGLTHTHDVKPWKDNFLVCASHAGNLYQAAPVKKLATISTDFLRGIAVGDTGIWLGLSPRIDKKMRYENRTSAHIVRIDSQTMQPVDKVEIPGAGQINDMIYLP